MTQAKKRGAIPRAHLPSHDRRPAPASRAACTVGATSWTRTMPHPVRHGPHRGGQRALEPVVDRRRVAVGPGGQPAEERLAAGADDHRAARSPPAGRGGAAAAGCGRRSCRSRCRGRSTPRPPRPPSASVGPVDQEVADLGHHVVVVGVDLHGRRARPACAWPPSRRRRPAATGHSEAETSLMRVAPAATAASATAALRVSTETRTRGRPAPRSPGPPGGAPRPRRPARRPGRVDSPPTSTTSAPSAIRSSPWPMAASGSNQRPPSENESGVTLRTPITKVTGVTLPVAVGSPSADRATPCDLDPHRAAVSAAGGRG